VHLTHAAGTRTLVTAGYMLRFRDEDRSVLLCDPDGRVWSQLSLLADVDSTETVDESYDVGAAELNRHRVGDSDVLDVTVPTRSSAWRQKSVQLRCFEQRLELRVRVEGSGTLADVRMLGGRAVLPSGACGTFRSSINFASVFVPTPTEPVQVVRPAFAAATLGIVGDASPGRLHGIFSPPPLCLVFGREQAPHATRVPDGGWLAVGVAAHVSDLRFNELRYLPVDGGFLVELDYDSRTPIDGRFVSPALVIRPAESPWRALASYRQDLIERGFAVQGPAERPPQWWSEPIFCGWGAQCARAAWPPEQRSRPRRPGPDPDRRDSGDEGTDNQNPSAEWLARQELYDQWLARLAAHDVVPGTVVIDDRWQRAYGTGEPDTAKWPDLRGWIAARHAAGQRVLLWWKAWDPEGLPADECVLDPGGVPIAADPGSPAYLEHLAQIVAELLGPDGVDADGFKIDFTQRSPTGRLLQRPGAPAGAPWGIAALHAMLRTIHRSAKAAKPDALVVTHTPHPSFADVTDMIRLNDVLDRDVTGAVVPATDQLEFRHAVVSQALPGHLVDTDQWPIADLATWRAYVTAQSRLGVPALYYAERLDRSGEELTAADLALVAASWREYRHPLRR